MLNTIKPGAPFKVGPLSKELAPAFGPDAKGVVITLVTPDVDGWHAALKAKGVTILEPPAYHASFDVYCFFAADPNGYKLEFQTFRDPSWKMP